MSFCLERNIRQAAKAAPYPLSIFTTVIPLAQLFNIESNAVNPLNDVHEIAQSATRLRKCC